MHTHIPLASSVLLQHTHTLSLSLSLATRLCAPTPTHTFTRPYRSAHSLAQLFREPFVEAVILGDVDFSQRVRLADLGERGADLVVDEPLVVVPPEAADGIDDMLRRQLGGGERGWGVVVG